VNFLCQNSPNPFRNTTSVRFGIAEQSHASIDVFDAAGRRLKSLFTGEAAPGNHVVTWDGTAETGSPVPSGTYFLRMVAGRDSFTRRMVVLR
jgi:flagellar hook assembly protein FlgD